MSKGRFTAPRTSPEETQSPKPFPFRKLALPLGIAAVALAVVFGGYFLIQTATDPYDSRIVSGVSIGGLDVGGMTKSEARKALQGALEETLYAQPLVITLPESTISLSPEETGLEVDVKEAVKAAYAIGRTEGTGAETIDDVGLLSYLTVEESVIRSALEAYAKSYDTDLTQPAYALIGEQPVLDVANFDPEAACQTLELTVGLPTAHLAVDQAYGSILAEYDRAIGEWEAGTYGIVVEIPLEELPDPLDLDSIYLELNLAPVDDSLDMDTYQQVPGSYGYTFDYIAAKQALSQAGYGQTLSFPMEYVEPAILGDAVYFRDVLGYCETKHNTNENRNTNLRVLCETLNGVIIQPGETFSYNETLGERTEEKGYLPAPGYSGNRLIDVVGGGVCQGSSTLYNCVLLADLEVVTRLCHGAKVNYLPLGLDAAVNWGTTDFAFRNNFNFPIMIQAEVSDGYVKMKLLGTDEKDYYIKMTSGYDDSNDNVIYAVSYKNKYDKETDELISKEREAFSTYYTNIG